MHPTLILLPPSGPGPAGNTHGPTSHTHTMVRPPIKSKVVCFYWSFVLTSGLSFWRLYLSASSWKFSVDNAQCFQLGENQTPGVLAIFPPPPPPEPTSPPSFPPQPAPRCRSLLLPFTLLPPAGEGGLPPLQITHTKRRWWRRWRSELPVQGPVSINETMKVYFARMHVLNSFLCDSWLGNVSVNLIKDSAGSHYFLSTPVPDGVKVHHLHPWLVQGEAPSPWLTYSAFSSPLKSIYLFVCWEESSFFFSFTNILLERQAVLDVPKRKRCQSLFKGDTHFLQNRSRYPFNTPAQMNTGKKTFLIPPQNKIPASWRGPEDVIRAKSYGLNSKSCR